MRRITARIKIRKPAAEANITDVTISNIAVVWGYRRRDTRSDPNRFTAGQ